MPGKQVKDWKRYHKLKKRPGVSKSKAARRANAAAKARRNNRKRKRRRKRRAS